MRNWWTTVGAVALCAAMAPQAFAATTHARSHAPQSSLRGHQSADEDEKPGKGKKQAAAEKACAAAKTRAAKAKACKGLDQEDAKPAKKPTAAERAADKACASAKTKAAKARFCKKDDEDAKPAKKPTAAERAAEKACANAKTKAAKAKFCKKEDEADDTRPSARRGGKDDSAETVIATGSLPDARGKVREVSPAPEKVGKGDTLSAISRRTGVSTDELIELNKLKKPYHVRVGATLKLPRTRAYTVAPGDTLSGVARRFSVDADVLAAFNSFGVNTPIRSGQKIELPPNAEDKAAKAKPAPAKPAPPAARPKPPVTRPAPPATRAPEPESPPAEEEPQAPPPAAQAPQPQPQPYTPPAQTGSYPGATALPPVRKPSQTTAPETPPQKTPPNVSTPQNIAPAPKPAPSHPSRPATVQPTYPAPQPERPNNNPPEESSGFQMIPAPSQTPPNARPTYGQRPAPQQTPPPASTYRPPATSGRPAIIQTNPAPTQNQVAQAGRGRFIWPVRGNVLSGYGLKANGQKNDGLNISVTVGEPVRAAAAGEVVYAGDQVPSFGNLVLIKHSGGWVTAYAHLGRIAVANRDQVAQGQQIGVAGQTGSVDQPQLHFEMRYAASPQDKALPIDPALVLPER